MLLASVRLFSQQANVPGIPLTANNTPQKDTTNRTNKIDWHNEKVRINIYNENSAKEVFLDTSLYSIHERRTSKDFWRDLGNEGSTSYPLFFTPLYEEAGPSLGYHAFDLYRLFPSQLYFYNVNKPYTDFGYQLGSKLEQFVNVLHTQNARPYLNFAVQYQKLLSTGFYQLQRTNQDHVSLSSHYQSRGLHYELYGAFVYNKEQQDENGGILSYDYLNDLSYTNRQTIPVAYIQDPTHTTARSARYQ